MPGLVPRRRKRTPEGSVDEENSDAASSSSTGSKRARYDRDASEESSATPVQTHGHRKPSGARNGYHDEDEYTEEPHQPGSIVRVKLNNFVTYTAAEFHPGPSLNMVIGPNGTGKSTLVCAICLGLGWSPLNLGRAKELGEFVKHGSREAEIEIELAAAKNQSTNPVIRRVIKKDGNKSVFYINGRQSTQKEVVRLAKSFAIQIDNLCQFLPQDRVAEFAGLTPIDLLRETQRAAAPDEMVQWHEQLKDLRKEEKRVEIEQRNEQGLLTQLQAKQNATREDVERWHQRQELIMKAQALEKCKPIIEMRLLKRQVDEIKAERQSVKQELQQLEREVAPAREAQEDQELYRNTIDQVLKHRKPEVDRTQKSADAFITKIKAEQDVGAEASNQINVEKESEKERRQDTKRLEQAIAQIERDMQQAPVEFDGTAYNDRKAQLSRKIRDNDDRTGEIRAEMTTIASTANELKAKMQAKVNARANLDSQSGQQESKLKKLSEEAVTAWRWVQGNRHKFKGEIFGPPVITCTVSDKSFADALENRLQKVDLTAFTCTEEEDLQFLQENLYGAPNNFKEFSIRTAPQPLAYYRPPASREELQRYGFEGWLLDFVQGPEPVVAMLCENAKLQLTAVTRNQLSDTQFQALQDSRINGWIAGKESFQTTRRREYGASSTKVSALKPARIFTDKPVDAEEKRQLDDAIRDIRREIDELKDRHTQLKEELAQLREQSQQYAVERNEVEKEKSAKQKAYNDWKVLPNKKANKEDELRRLQELMADTSRRILEHKNTLEKSALKVASLTLEYAASISAYYRAFLLMIIQKAVALLQQAHDSLFEAEIRLVEANSELESLKEENAHINQQLDEKKNAIKQLEERKKSLVAQYNRILKKTQGDLNELSEDEAAIVRDYQNLPNIDDLNAEINAVHARLELMADGNPNAIRAYENREKEIERAQERIEEMTERLGTMQEEIARIRGQWEPELDKLVAKISDGFAHNFQKIGCAGQVCVNKDEDFEQWSIQIQVRFREHEPLSVLDSQRQSGGERAVSTIFYLMALQDLTRSPFRVVDEINQGMDPRNERMVHERMVDIACRERTSQYFLITPKLLNDLKFHPKMKIHCIASGEWMPERYDKLDFGRLAQLAMRVKAGKA